MGGDAVEKAIGLLNPTHVRLDGAGGGGATLTPDMVSSALGSVSDQDGASLLVAKVIGENRFVELERCLHPRLLGQARRERWKVKQSRVFRDKTYVQRNNPKGQVVLVRTLDAVTRAMLRLALLEFLAPIRCPKCEGRRVIYSRAQRKDTNCLRCKGHGSIPLTGRERARHVGFAPDVWRTIWAPRYKRIQAWLDDLYGTAEGDVRRKLG